MTQDLIKNADAMIAEVSLPSTGQGIEIGWASIFKVPIICIHEKGSRYSPALMYVTETFIEYESAEDMIIKLSSALQALRP